MLAFRAVACGLAALALGGLLAGSATGAPDFHGQNVWAGQWTTSTGGVAFQLLDAEAIANAKTERRHAVLFDKLPCKGSGPQFYRGGYTNPNGDAGKVIACGTPQQLSGRWSSNVTEGNNGSFTISISSTGAPPLLKFKGAAIPDGGAKFDWTGEWTKHFQDDGCCGAEERKFRVQYAFRHVGYPVNENKLLGRQRISGSGKLRLLDAKEGLAGGIITYIDERRLREDLVLKLAILTADMLTFPDMDGTVSTRELRFKVLIVESNDPKCLAGQTGHVYIKDGPHFSRREDLPQADEVTILVCGLRHQHSYRNSSRGSENNVRVVIKELPTS